MGGWISLAWFPAVPANLFTPAGVAGILDGLLDGFAGFPGPLLNAPDQFFLFAFGVLEIVIRELGPFLFQLALGDVPVAFDFKFGHDVLILVLVWFHLPSPRTVK
jgi:hypothetical protein